MRTLLLSLLLLVACDSNPPKKHIMQYEQGDKVMLKIEIPAVVLRVSAFSNKYLVRVVTEDDGMYRTWIEAFEIEKRVK